MLPAATGAHFGQLKTLKVWAVQRRRQFPWLAQGRCPHLASPQPTVGRLFLEACRIRRSVSAAVHKVDFDCLDGDTALKPSVSSLQTCTPPSSANIGRLEQTRCRTWPLVPGPALVALPGPPFFLAHLGTY